MPWHDARDDELRHVLREAAQRATRGGTRTRLTRKIGAGADEVGELAEHGQQHGAGERVADDHPAHLLERAELAGDRGERGRDDGVVERAEERDGEKGDDEEAEPDRRERHTRVTRTIGSIDATVCAPAAASRPGTGREGPDVMSILSHFGPFST